MYQHNVVYAVPFRGIRLFVEFAPSQGTINDWRALLPGRGSRAPSLLPAIQSVIAMWENIGSPTESRFYGNPPTDITLDELLSFARSYERAWITELLSQ
jgi:hypothetical protein